MKTKKTQFPKENNKKAGKWKVGIYLRVSTGKQEVENQLMQLKPYCKKRNWEIHDIYVDIISGKEEKRPEFDRIFTDAHKRLFDLVLFWDLSRFSRAGIQHTLNKLKELENIGLNWVSYQEKYLDTLNPAFKEMVLSIFASINRIERENISDKTKAGLDRKKKELKKKGGRLGRPGVPDHAVKEIIRLHNVDPARSHADIRAQVSYKIKYGALRRPSIGFISKIRNDLSKKGC